MAASNDPYQTGHARREAHSVGASHMPIPITVTSTDSTGQLFQERTFVLGLEGRNCQYQSKHEVSEGHCVSLDFDYTAAGQQPCRVKGRVKWLKILRTDRKLFQVGVELDASQSAVVIPDHQADQSKSQCVPATRLPAITTEPVVERLSERQAEVAVQIFPQLATGLGATTTTTTNSEAKPRTSANILAMARRTTQSAKVAESGPEPGTFKTPLSSEVEESARAVVGSVLERMVRDAVEQQIAQQCQSLSDVLADQLAGRLVESEMLRTYFENMTAIMADRLIKLSQTAVSKTEADLNNRASAIRQSTEEAIVDMQARLDETQESLANTVARAQQAEQELTDIKARIQEAREQLMEAGRIANGLDERLRSRVDPWTIELKNGIDQMITESTARWASGVEQYVVPYLQRADEKLQILAAGMQLAQVQQDRLAAELSRTAVAIFEKEMRELSLRFSANG